MQNRLRFCPAYYLRDIHAPGPHLFCMDPNAGKDLFENVPDYLKKLRKQSRSQARTQRRAEFKEKYLKHGTNHKPTQRPD